jgi:hypothetical protein
MFFLNLGLKYKNLGKVIYNVPQLLVLSIKENMVLIVKQKDIWKLVTWHPQLLTLSMERNPKPTISYLLDLGFIKQELLDMIIRLPSLSGFNITIVLHPKYKYLVDSMKCSWAKVV